MASAVGLAGAALVLLLFVFPPQISIAPADQEFEVNPATGFLEVGTSRWGASLSTISVVESKIAPDGSREAGKLLDGRLEEGRFVRPDGSNPLLADAEYTVKVTGTVSRIGLSGVYDEPVEQTHTFTTITTPMPIIPKEGIKVKYGEDVKIEWNVPVASFDYQIEGVTSTLKGTEEEGRIAKIALGKFEQGKEYPLKITAATSNNGVEMKQPMVSAVATAPPLTVSFDPADGTTGTSIEAHPTLVFSEPVSNPDLAASLITIDPKVEGTFKWVEPNKLEFTPKAPWEHLQDVTVRIKGGPTLLRGVGGGYLERDEQSTFSTAPEKSIDVNITEQRMTLFENGNAVDSFLVSTGNKGTDTPIGDFVIYAKITKTDMRGEGYFAPAVPWVLVFKGDYTIHGNYWATAFGRRSSHGCVGLPVETAKRVFEWTPVGTPVHIHE